MNYNHSLILATEVERVLYEASSVWEGIDAHEIPLDVGETILRKQPGFARGFIKICRIVGLYRKLKSE